MRASRMPASFPERASKRIVIAAIALAIPLHFYIDPAGGVLLSIVAALVFAAALGCARIWRSVTLVTVTASTALMPVVLAALVHVDALNLFSTVTLAALFGALLPRVPWDRWALPGSWRAPLGIWALTLSLA